MSRLILKAGDLVIVKNKVPVANPNGKLPPKKTREEAEVQKN
jgi:hypothetical protein